MATTIAGGELTQSGRLLQIDTPLGADVFSVRSLHGQEAISQLFQIDVKLASENFTIAPESLVGKPATLRVIFNNSEQRFVNGFINRFTLVPTKDKLAEYRARIVPAFWFLTRTTDCFIFQNQTTPEIVETVFKKYGVTNYEPRLTGTYAKREYCVQYRETAFQFVSRLLEEEGICYFFEHTDTSHTIVLADSPSGHKACQLEPQVKWEPGSGGGFNVVENYIQDWERTLEVYPTKWTQADFQFKKPLSQLIDTVPTLSTVLGPALEKYDYPGRFDNTQIGDQLTTVRMEEEEAEIDTIYGQSTCRGFTPGSTFQFTQSFRADQAGSYLLTALEYEAEQGSLYVGDTGASQRYQNRFRAIPASKTFRPPRTTARPFIRGPQTAFVTGTSGEEIYVDQYGRVKVQFHWDREGTYNEASSCWIRVSQSIAGKDWGAMQLPRVGHEVIVEFLEGDPDRPVITGRLYNADHTTPYKLPDDRSKTTLKTLSYPGGGGFNEIRLDDQKGSEQFFIHGEKDMDVRIKNDRREWIGRDRHLIAQRDKLEQIARDKQDTIQRDLVQSISRDHHLTISGKQAISITGSQSTSISGDVIEQFSGNQSTQVTGCAYIKGMTVVVEGLTGVTLKVGGSFVTINDAGVQISGPMVLINSGGAALSGTPGNLVSPIMPTAPAVADDAKPGEVGSLPSANQAGSGSTQ